MHIEVRAEGDGREADLRSLQDWLRQEPAVRHTAAVSLREQPPKLGQMGTWIDALQLVTGNGWSAASFALSVAAWRRTRPRAPRLVLRRGDVEVTMVEYTDAEVQRVIALLEEPGAGQGPQR